MEKARLRQEKMDIAANTAAPPKAHAAATKPSSATQTKVKQQQKKEPEYFSAQVPDEKAPKKVPGKSAKTKSANKT